MLVGVALVVLQVPERNEQIRDTDAANQSNMSTVSCTDEVTHDAGLYFNNRCGILCQVILDKCNDRTDEADKMNKGREH